MEFKTVTYLAAFPHPELGTFAPLKLGLEINLNEGDTVEMALDAAKQKLENWNKEQNKSIWTNPEGMTGTITRNSEDKRPLIEQMNECTEVDNELGTGLKTFRMVPKTQEEQEFYNNKLKELVNGK